MMTADDTTSRYPPLPLAWLHLHSQSSSPPTLTNININTSTSKHQHLFFPFNIPIFISNDLKKEVMPSHRSRFNLRYNILFFIKILYPLFTFFLLQIKSYSYYSYGVKEYSWRVKTILQ